jgi:hypothetical protein
MRRWIWHILVGAVLPAVCHAQIQGYEFLASWNDLPRAKTAFVAGLASSYDRSSADEDSNQYLRPEGFQCDDVDTVIAEVPGPGLITRFWMPHRTADQAFAVRLVIDGMLRIDTTSDVLLGGQYGYFRAPLVQTRIGGQVCYEPIVFARSLRIESNNLKSSTDPARRHFYQYNYLLLPASQPVVPYSGTLTPTQQKARFAAAGLIRNLGSNPAGPSDTAVCQAIGEQTIAASASYRLAEVHGPGTVRCINLKMRPGVSDVELDSLRLCIRYDGASAPAVDVPVAHFFGAGHGRALYRSLPLGTDSPAGYYCYWPMPFRRGLAVDLRNAGPAPVTFDSARVEVEPGTPARDAGYLCAAFCQETTRPGQKYHVLLEAAGAGHYVGNLLYLDRQGGRGGLLEGDDIVIVNPGTGSVSILHGTGIEDAYNGGFYYNHEQVLRDPPEVACPQSGTSAFHGLLFSDYSSAAKVPPCLHVSQYRWLIGDFIPFRDGIVAKVENYGGQGGIVFGSTVFYYQLDRVAGVTSAPAESAGSRPARQPAAATQTRPAASKAGRGGV